MRPRIPPVLTWAQVLALPTDAMGPIDVIGYGLMCRDPRNGLWVPAKCLDPVSFTQQWQLTINTDLAHPPAGFAVTKVGGADLTGGGGNPLIFTAPGNGDQLYFAWTGTSALAKRIVLAIDQDTTDPPAGNLNNTPSTVTFVHNGLYGHCMISSGYEGCGVGTGKTGVWIGTNYTAFWDRLHGRNRVLIDLPATISLNSKAQFHVLGLVPTCQGTCPDSAPPTVVGYRGFSSLVANDQVSFRCFNTTGAPTVVTNTLYAAALYVEV